MKKMLPKRFFSLKKKLSKLFCAEEAGKKVININKLFLFLTPPLVVVFIASDFFDSYDSSFLRHSTGGIGIDTPAQVPPLVTHDNRGKRQPLSGGISDVTLNHSNSRQNATSPPIKYRAKQVIIRDESDSQLPTGTTFNGKLLTSIDTRNKDQWAKVILPDGGWFKERFKEQGFLPKETVLIGTINYPGKGKRVFINFSKAVLPSGQELGLQAQALTPKTHVLGLTGEYYSQKGRQIATILGLSMVSGMTEALTEKEGVKGSESTTPKATMENAFYHGLSKVTNMEAQRQTSELDEHPPYVTIPAGTNLIINLTSPLKGDFLEYESE